MKLLLVIVFGLAFCSCSTIKKDVGCSVETEAAQALSQAIAKGLACANIAQIQSDLLSVLGPVDLCSTTSKFKGPIGNVACPLAVSAAMNLLNKAVPSSWGCMINNTDGLSQTLTSACEVAVPI
jgi:hypothetical protein